MRIALVQLASSTDSAANRDLVGARLGDLDSSLDLVVLPEATMHDFGAIDHDLAAVAEPLDGPFVATIVDQARRLGATVVAGMFERPGPDGRGDLPFNTLVVAGPDGSLLDTYRKIHLYDSFGYRESERLSAGDVRPVTIDVEGVRTGLMTCYDLRFPEMGRSLVDAGAELFVVPSAWVAGEHKLHHWRTLLTARAVENTVAVAAAAQGGKRYTGHSLIVDAWGSVLGEAGDGDDLVQASVEPADIAKARDVNPSLSNRRIDA
ncbi:carbon-nitrogen hydrolase family protein [Aeromicrobium sp.]|uniref:carbon-nitrogen hydrolase family protein n=1 Tax=Aeromicrobium sp. TaxID=1871063 RepID=UPI003D6BD3E0